MTQFESYCNANALDPSSEQNDRAIVHIFIASCSKHQLQVLKAAFGDDFNAKTYAQMKEVLENREFRSL